MFSGHRVHRSSSRSRRDSAFAYGFEGEARFDDRAIIVAVPRWLCGAKATALKRPCLKSGRFPLVSGKPSNEPIARYDPFVMNTSSQIEQRSWTSARGRLEAEI